MNSIHRSQRACGLLFVALFLLLPPAFAADSSAALKGLDARIEQLMSDWTVPGAAVAIVKDDKVIYSKGHGVLEAGKKAQVNNESMFAIGSASKAFTAAAIAILVDEGKLSWDDPVTDHLPWFKLFDPYATREMRVRDLLAHNSGLTRGDRVWYGTGLSSEEIVRRARFMPPTKSFRSTFQYNNTMFIAAGLVIEAVSGMSWDDFVTQRILQPLHMNASNTSVTALEDKPNVISPHKDFNGIARPVPWRNIDNAGPAGSINSATKDMVQWVRLHLGKGEFEGKRIISEANVAEMRTSQMIMRKEGFSAELYAQTSMINYGLGWFLTDYKGELMASHGGNIDGNSALVTFMPVSQIGVVILTNMDGANLFTSALNYEIYDRLLGGNDKDWNTDLKKAFETATAQGEVAIQKIKDSRITGTSPSLPLRAFSGSYDHEMYPGVEVVERNGGLLLTFAEMFEAQLEHWNYDTFKATWNIAGPDDGPPSFVRFDMGTDGKPSVVHVDIEGLIPFNRRAEAEPAK